MRPTVLRCLLLAGCYAQDQTFAQSTFVDPMSVAGPPGGEMDPQSGYTQSGYENPGPAQGYEVGLTDPQAEVDATAAVTDTEIDTTLQPYGEWIADDNYGRVWRPYATVVGVDFTPYETCGSWVNSSAGWAFDCDWNWGWLPFHYGRWGWFDDGGYWGWVPGYEWTPAAVEWRNGGGYVGWRPLTPQIRDHRGEHEGPTFHDHRGEHEAPTFHDHRASSHDAHWRFATETDFGKPHIRSHELRAPAEGLQATTPVAQLPIRPSQPIRAANLMRARLMTNPHWSAASSIGSRPMQPARPMTPMRPEAQTWQRQPVRTVVEPTWQRQAVRTYQPPAYHPTYQQPTYQPPTYQQPVRTYQPQTYRPPMQTYRPPSDSFRPSMPSHQSYNPPSHTSSWSGSSRGSYSPPAMPSHSSSGGWGGGGGSRGGGGGDGSRGGRHR